MDSRILERFATRLSLIPNVSISVVNDYTISILTQVSADTYNRLKSMPLQVRVDNCL
jgi:hypothetical protein